MDRVLEAFRLSHDRRGRAAYISWLEACAENEGGKIDAKAMEATWRLVSRGVRRQGQAPGVNGQGRSENQ